MTVAKDTEIPATRLRWRCDPDRLPFETTAEVNPARQFVGQATAREALLFGLQCQAPGQNIYIRGPRGTGRQLLVRSLLTELDLQTDAKRDRCFVHNFKRPDRPRLVSLAPGQSSMFRERMLALSTFVQGGLRRTLEADPYSAHRQSIRESVQQQAQGISAPFEQSLAEKQLALVTMQSGDVTAPMILPIVDGQPVSVEQFQTLAQQGKVTAERLEQFEQEFPALRQQMHEIARQVSHLVREGTRKVEEFNQRTAQELLANLTEQILHEFPGEGVAEFVQEVVDDVIRYRLREPADEEAEVALAELYGVNIVLQHDASRNRPVVEELTPSMINLLGTVEPRWSPEGSVSSDYTGIRGGALLQADQGFLILDAEDVLNEPGAWRALMRTIRTGQLEIVPPEVGWMRPYVVVQPETIPIKVRVILIGDVRTFYLLDEYDSDFRDLFKVLADFDDQIERSDEGLQQYAAVLARLSRAEELPHFERGAVAALVEHGARIIAHSEKLTARFGRIADIAREAAFLTLQAAEANVTSRQVKLAVQRTKARASLPSRRFQEFVENRTIIIQTSGAVIGQINGLAVMQAGPLTYGFPARITATIGAGRAGLIDIEGSARLSGTIHTKGFYILGGLIRRLLPTNHPLAFSASLAFEQSYGGIDGDSASCAEICCLLSALTDIPVRQNLAITGAIDQHGNVQAIGGVNEKIEGFFDTCQYFGLTGDQGVVIPVANAPDLMLREDVVEAAAAGRFHIYAVQNVYEALELMTGFPVGRLNNGAYLPGTLLYIALGKAHEYWRRALAGP